MDGLLVVDKPLGLSSHAVVARARRALGERRIGHTGTLDPLATGVLPLVVGRATRLARFLSAGDKSYEATVRLGLRTDSDDREGTPIGGAYTGPMPTRAAIDLALDRFRGTVLQQPPVFSAKKVAGRRSYRAARAARSVDPGEPAPGAPVAVTVTAYSIELVSADSDTVTLSLDCSAGYYVRALARDLGEALGTGAHLAALRRTRSAGFGLADAVALEMLEQDRDRALRTLLPVSRMLPELRAVRLTAEGARRASRGGDVSASDVVGELGDAPLPGGYLRLFDPSGDLLAIAEPTATPGLLHPAVVLV